MYVNFNENPRGNYYAGDCVVRAINIVTGISWDEIYTTLCAEGFYLGDWGNTEDFIDEIEELIEKAPDEHTRKKFERFLSEMK